ncbi:MAG: DegV family protein [Lachnospiraceae bacterium]|nr:DegV family protein [Lachnospiraceae bacterium]
MSKVAILTDSSSAIRQAEAKELGVYVLPMPFFINEQTLYEDIDLTQETFYEHLGEGVDVSTSMPAVGQLTECWDNLLQDYDEVVYIPMSSGLSSSCETAMAISMQDEYEEKVFVVNNQRVSVTQKQSVFDAMKLVEQGKTAAEIKKILEDQKFESSIYIMVDTLYYLKKGGRITPAAAALGTLLKLKPVLQIQGEKLDAFAKARTVKQAKSIMLEAIAKDLEERFHDSHADEMQLCIAYTKDLEAAEQFKQELLERFPGKDIMMDPLSLNVACHIGPGALAVAIARRL